MAMTGGPSVFEMGSTAQLRDPAGSSSIASPHALASAANLGNEVATLAVSRISMSPSAWSEATANDMAMEKIKKFCEEESRVKFRISICAPSFADRVLDIIREEEGR